MDDDKSDHDPLGNPRFKLNLGLTLKKAGDDSGKFRSILAFLSVSCGIDYLFRHVDTVRRVSTWSGNERMIRRRPAVAWWREGRIRKARIVRGRYYDSVKHGDPSGKMGSDDEGVISLFGVKIDDCLKGLSTKRPIFC